MEQRDASQEICGYLILFMILLFQLLPSNHDGEIDIEDLESKRVLEIPVAIKEYDLFDLETLPGIGPEIAQRIVASGASTCEDLYGVRGIGEKKLMVLRPYFKDCFEIGSNQELPTKDHR